MADYQPSFETLVHLAEKRGVLLASVLAIYQQRYNLSDAQLSEQLHCTMENLIHLKLCDVPRSDHFQEDVQGSPLRNNLIYRKLDKWAQFCNLGMKLLRMVNTAHQRSLTRHLACNGQISTNAGAPLQALSASLS